MTPRSPALEDLDWEAVLPETGIRTAPARLIAAQILYALQQVTRSGGTGSGGRPRPLVVTTGIGGAIDEEPSRPERPAAETTALRTLHRMRITKI
jgi:hypothetical protein